MAKFKAGDAVKLRDDVQIGEMCGDYIVSSKFIHGTKYHIALASEYKSGLFVNDYRIQENGFLIDERALEAWPESTEETSSNEIDPQLFELVKAVTTGLVSNTNFTYIHNDEVVFSCKTAVDIAREIHRLLREEKSTKP